MKGQIIVTDREGKVHELEAEEGYVLMEIIRDAGLPIEAACGGCAACATCHVYVDQEWITSLNLIEDDEESMLDQTFFLKKNSRLSCQIEYKNNLNGIKLTLAPE
ncbi:MAG: Ferredoxin-6 [Alphaproteobacteria bacterium MarineAlpha5_Bin11]|nr:ferredoxin [Pelagibacteraceae bacterium]PPR42807.1 MAG: Ferredoxin-6 [Alphaproteobacteria bacterium MarineAlpha5_Bin11]PPR52028.1 MAG: Ferredoxin-6 [Alphaproteobacteria bacterium MarineAlpha5_Bin10]|tara:strand:+ start:1161 stop:1475 length:315 start_codon:yes stop_codon:yes gene_type:complete